MSGYPPPYPPPGPPPGHDWKYQRRILKEQARAQRDVIRAQREAYRYQYRSMRRGSIVGPLLVVALGIVFLLVQTGRLRSFSLWSWYGRWWPLLLVGVGVVLLVEWAFDRAAQRDGNVPYVRHGIGGGVIVLLIFMAITGAIWGGFTNLHRDFFNHGFNFNPDDIDTFFGDKHESDQTFDQAFPANSALNVTNPRGDVTVSGTSDDNQIHIALHKQVYTRSDSEADNRAKELSPHIDTSPNGSFGSTLNINVPSLEGTHADLVITVPATAPVTVTANHGDVHVNSVKAPVTVTANHGDIELSAITGAVNARINNGSSSFAAHSVTGMVSLTGHGRDVTLSDIDGSVNLNGEFFGDTHLERIRNTVKFHTSRTDFQLARLDGEVEISPNSDLSGSQALGPVTLTTRSRNISLEHVAGDLSVSNSNGSVDVVTAPPLGNVTVENRNGSVSVTVPEQAAFTVQAQTRNGDAENDFSLPTQEENNRKNFGGTVGKGGSLIRINTSEGDIALRKANLAPLPPLPPMPPPISITSPDGSSVIVNKDGTRIVSGPGGNNVYSAKDGTRLITSPDGTIVYTGKDGTHYTSNPDGTKIYAGSNGVRITATPDGRIVAIGASGKVLSDSEARDQLNHAEDLVRKATAEEQREKTTNTNH
jgi:DUF4097 and DUF4098 domain-containing protein YvlB